MAYRIQYTDLDGALSAVVRGKSSLAAAGCIARDIAAHAARQSLERVLVDLRWLEDRVGALRALRALPCLRVAVLDLGENDPRFTFSEPAEMRSFAHAGAALRWLQADRRIDPASQRGDRKAPTPAGAPVRVRLKSMPASLNP
jgi:hypothetical protein